MIPTADAPTRGVVLYTIPTQLIFPDTITRIEREVGHFVGQHQRDSSRRFARHSLLRLHIAAVVGNAVDRLAAGTARRGNQRLAALQVGITDEGIFVECGGV